MRKIMDRLEFAIVLEGFLYFTQIPDYRNVG